MKKVYLIFIVTCTMIIASNAQAQPAKGTLERLVYDYAPKLWLQSTENYRLSTPEWYFKQCRMLHFNPRTPLKVTKLRETVTDQNILFDYKVDGKTRNTGDWLDHDAHEQVKLEPKTGNDWKWGQNMDKAKCYVNIRVSQFQNKPSYAHDIDIIYFYFFPNNGGTGTFNSGWHQGDWEHVIVKVSPDGKLKNVFLSQHGGGKWYPKIGRTGTHPIVYAAEGSHALYEREGSFSGNRDDTNKGEAFISWKNYEIIGLDGRIIDTSSDPIIPKKYNWVNFKGLWGTHHQSSLFASGGNPPGPKTNWKNWIGKDQNGKQGRTADYREGYPDPKITGSTLLCSTSNKRYAFNVSTSQGYPKSYKWQVSKSSVFTKDTGTGSAFSTRSDSPSNQGKHKITGVIYTHYKGFKIKSTASRSVWLGKPKNLTGVIDGPAESYQGMPQRYKVINNNTIDQGSFVWTVPYTSQTGTNVRWSIYSGGNGHDVMYVNVGKNSGNVRVRKENTCGASTSLSKFVKILSTPGGGSFKPKTFSRNRIEEEQFLNTTVYPNPVVNRINIQINKSDFSNDVLSLRIFDVSGHLVTEKSTNESSLDINVSQFKKGLYILKISDSGHVVTKNFIVGG